MLTLYRRHHTDCKLAKLGVAANNCACPVWTYGSINGRPVRESLHTKDWTLAHVKMIALEAGTVQEPAIQPTAVSVRASIGHYISDCEARSIARSTIRGYTCSLEPLAAWCELNSVKAVSELSIEHLQNYRATRKVAARTAYKELTNLRSWCEFATDRGLLKVNIARKVKAGKQEGAITMPYTQEEVARLLAAAHSQEVRALMLTLLYSGLRISDAVQLERSRLGADGRLMLRVMKTGVALYARLPENAVFILSSLLPLEAARFFWDGKVLLDSAIDRMRKELVLVGASAHVADVRPHRFRDTFAVELLLAGEDIRTVQLLLGHTSLATTEKHYAPFVSAMRAKLENATAKLKFG